MGRDPTEREGGEKGERLGFVEGGSKTRARLTFSSLI